MSVLFAIPFLVLGEFSFQISPERLGPIVYSDEALLVKIWGVPTGTSALSGSIRGSRGHVTQIELGLKRFEEDQPYYVVIPDANIAVGEQALTLRIAGIEVTNTYYALHRPDHSGRSPFGVSFRNWNDDLFASARDIPLSSARLFGTDPLLREAIDRLYALGIDTHFVAHQSDAPANEDVLEEWLDAFGHKVVSWEFEFTENLAELNRLIRSLVRLRPDAKIGLRVGQPVELKRFLENPESPYISQVIVTTTSLDSNQLHEYRVTAELAGLETIELTIDNGASEPDVIWKQMTTRMQLLSPVSIHIPASNIAGDHEQTGIYNGWARLLSEYMPIGPYYIRDDVTAHLFQHRQPGNPWVLALSTDVSTVLDVPPEIGSVSFFGSWAAPSKSDPITALTVESMPTFVAGSDNVVVSRALCNALALDASLLLGVDAYASAFSPPIINALISLKGCEPGDSFRDTFFALLFQLPELERRYQEGQLPTHVVIPVVARLTRIARVMCALEQEANRAFLEPAESTLARCNEFLAEYLSKGISVTRIERNQQLFGEINRLISESTELSANGRPIEAAGIAIIAEWRARTLLDRSN